MLAVTLVAVAGLDAVLIWLLQIMRPDISTRRNTAAVDGEFRCPVVYVVASQRVFIELRRFAGM
jgi:hypothetical protein